MSLRTLVGRIRADNPAIYYRLNEPAGTTGTVADSSGNGVTGTILNPIPFATTSFVPPDTAPTFNSTGGIYAATTGSPTLAARSVTIEGAVFVPETGSGLAGAVAWNAGYGIGVGGAGPSGTTASPGLQVIAYIGRYIATGAYLSSGWHLLALVIDANGHPSVYIDGALVYTDSGTPAVAATGTQYFTVGWNLAPQFISAPVAHAALFPTALSATRIAAHAAAIFDTPQVQQWQRPWPTVFDEYGNLLGVLYHTESSVITDQLIDINAEGQVDANSGQEVLDLTVAWPSPDAALLVNERRILTGGSQFRIRTVTEGFDSSAAQTVQVHAEAMWYDLGDYDAIRIDPPITTPAAAIAACCAGTPWSVGTVSVTVTALDPQVLVTTPTTPLAILRSLPSIFGGELWFDNINLKVNLEPFRGSQAGDWLYAHGLDIDSNSRVLDTTTLITRLYPLGANGLDITSVNGGKGYIENYSWYDTQGLPRVVRAESLENDAIGDPTALLVWGQQQLATLSQPKATYAVGTVQLAGGTGSVGTVPGLGDVVRVHDDALGYDLFTRVSQRTVDTIEPGNSTLQINTALYLISRMLPTAPRQTTVVSSSLALVAPAVSDNALPNGSMQTVDSTGFPSYWSTTPLSGTAAVSGAASLTLGGSRTLQVTAPTPASGGGGLSASMSVLTGEQWMVRADYLPVGPTPATHTVTLRVQFSGEPTFSGSVPVTGTPVSAVNPQILTPAGAVVVASPPSSTGPGYVDVIAGWGGGQSSGVSGLPYRLTGLVTVPPGAQFARAGVIVNPTAVTGLGPNYYEFDNLTMTRAGVGAAVIAGQIVGSEIATAISPPYVFMGPYTYPQIGLDAPGIVWVTTQTPRYDTFVPGITYLDGDTHSVSGTPAQTKILLITPGQASTDKAFIDSGGTAIELYSSDDASNPGAIGIFGTQIVMNSVGGNHGDSADPGLVEINAHNVQIQADDNNSQILVETASSISSMSASGWNYETFYNSALPTSAQHGTVSIQAGGGIQLSTTDIVYPWYYGTLVLAPGNAGTGPTPLPQWQTLDDGGFVTKTIPAGRWGTTTCEFTTASSTSATTTVYHGLGHTPSLILLTCYGGNDPMGAWYTAPTSTSFGITAYWLDGAKRTANYTVDWFAV